MLLLKLSWLDNSNDDGVKKHVFIENYRKLSQICQVDQAMVRVPDMKVSQG